jgi:hypothetical protein
MLTLAIVVAAAAYAADAKPAATSWKGEIVDIACYVPKAAHGTAHADCAKKCLKNGQPMGLLTGDGDMMLLVADHADGKAFESAKDMAGKNVEVSGTMAEKAGMKIVTVTGVKPAA